MPNEYQAPTTSPQDSLPEILTFLNHSYVDPFLILDRDHTPSKNTREPKPWDLHLDPSLVLKHVRYSPSVISSLRKSVDTALTARRHLPVLSLELKSSLTMLTEQSADLPYLQQEDNIKAAYRNLIAIPCNILSRTLYYDLSEWKDLEGVIKWEENSGFGQHAKPDAFLKVDFASLWVKTGDKREREAERPPYISEERFAMLRKMRDLFLNLAVWEFKSVVAGNYDVFREIMCLCNDKSEFPWVACTKEKPDCVKYHGLCTGARVGFDSSTFDGLRGEEYPGLDPKIEQIARDRARRYTTEIDRMSSKSNKSDHKTTTRKVQTSKSIPQPITKRKADSQSGQSPRTHACWILQQAWAECVRFDSTFVVVHSGEFEVIGIRCRKTQTLYLSDLIIPHSEPQYVHLHVGLFLAALQEAEDRTSKLDEALKKWKETKTDDVPQKLRLWEQVYAQTSTDNQALSDCPSLPAQQRRVLVTAHDQRKATLEDVAAAGSMIWPGKCPWPMGEDFYERKGPFPTDTTVDSTSMLHAKAHDADGMLGRANYVIECTLSVRKEGEEPRRIMSNARKAELFAAKMANGKDRVAILENEYSTYVSLAAQNVTGIPKIYGFYKAAKSRTDGRNSYPYAVMLMEKLLDPPVSSVDGQFSLDSALAYSEYRRILDQIHRAHYNHGSLELDHLLRTIDGRSVIVRPGSKALPPPPSTPASRLLERLQFGDTYQSDDQIRWLARREHDYTRQVAIYLGPTQLVLDKKNIKVITPSTLYDEMQFDAIEPHPGHYRYLARFPREYAGEVEEMCDRCKALFADMDIKLLPNNTDHVAAIGPFTPPDSFINTLMQQDLSGCKDMFALRGPRADETWLILLFWTDWELGHFRRITSKTLKCNPTMSVVPYGILPSIVVRRERAMCEVRIAENGSGTAAAGSKEQQKTLIRSHEEKSKGVTARKGKTVKK